MLAKAEPIKGCTSGITDLTWGKKLLCKRSLDRGMRTCERNSPADTKDDKEEGRRDSPGTGAEISLQPMLQNTVQQVVPLKPMEGHGDVEIHLQPMENPTLYQVSAQRRIWTHGKSMIEKAPDRTTGPMKRGACTGASLLAGVVTPWKTHSGATCS